MCPEENELWERFITHGSFPFSHPRYSVPSGVPSDGIQEAERSPRRTLKSSGMNCIGTFLSGHRLFPSLSRRIYSSLVQGPASVVDQDCQLPYAV